MWAIARVSGEWPAQAHTSHQSGGNSGQCQFVHDPRAGHKSWSGPQLVRKLFRVGPTILIRPFQTSVITKISMLSTATELSLETSDAVRLGLGLLNKVECLEAVPASEVSEPGLSDLTMSGGQMVETQHSPPMYPNTEAVAPAPGQPQQPKVQQMTDLSNCTVNTNSNANTNNNNNNTNNTNPAPTTMTNPLRIKHFGEHSDRELAELATQEISLDLQGLIDDTHFPDDNLFGDLMDTAKKNEVAMYGIGGQGMRGPGSASTPGSSGQNSPGSDGHNSPTGQPQGYPGHQHPGHYRQNTLGYIPGSVHHGTSYQQHHHHNHPQVSVMSLGMSCVLVLISDSGEARTRGPRVHQLLLSSSLEHHQ